MQYYPIIPIKLYNATTGEPGNLSYIDLQGTNNGTWTKGTTWTRKGAGGSAIRGLIADSETHVIGTSTNAAGKFTRSAVAFQDGAFGGTANTTVLLQPRGATENVVNVNAQRHLKPGRSINELRNSRGTNMLYCDMSVRSVTPAEAWIATRGGGIEP